MQQNSYYVLCLGFRKKTGKHLTTMVTYTYAHTIRTPQHNYKQQMVTNTNNNSEKKKRIIKFNFFFAVFFFFTKRFNAKSFSCATSSTFQFVFFFCGLYFLVTIRFDAKFFSCVTSPDLTTRLKLISQPDLSTRSLNPLSQPELPTHPPQPKI